MRGNISALHHRCYVSVLSSLTKFSDTPLWYSARLVCLQRFVLEPLKGFSRNLGVESFY